MDRATTEEASDETVRWGILGTGKIARILAGALAASQEGSLVCVGSRDPGRAEAFAAEFGVPHYRNYEGVIGDRDVDLVYVAVPHPFHREWAVAAAEAGKHVLCEKPIAVTHRDASAIVDAARSNDVFLFEAFAYRTHPQTHRLVELVRMGRIGEVRVIDAVFGYDGGPTPTNYLMDHELAGGGILDVGCYTTSMAHLIAAAAAGVPVAEASEVVGGAVIGPTGVDLSAAATLVFADGPLARVACSIRANLDGSLRIVGSEGRITVVSPWLPGWTAGVSTILVESAGLPPEVIEIPLNEDVYTVEVDAVNGSIRKGELSTPMMSWEDSLANMRTLDRWRSSAGLRFAADAVSSAGGA